MHRRPGLADNVTRVGLPYLHATGTDGLIIFDGDACFTGSGKINVLQIVKVMGFIQSGRGRIYLVKRPINL